MLRSCSRLWLAMTALLGLWLPLGAQDKPADSIQNSQAVSHDAALRALVEQYFAACVRKDLDVMMTLWRSQSPERAARKKGLEAFFASIDHLSVNHVEVQRAIIEGEKSQRKTPSLQTANQFEPDSTLRNLANDYFVGYSRKDLKGMMALWSTQSPDRDVRRRQLHDWFASANLLAVSDLSLTYTETSLTRAKLLLTFRVKASNEPAPEPRQMILSLTCVREDTAWKIWAESDEFENLAMTLINAKSETERSMLLSGNPEKVSPSLVVALVGSIRSLEAKGNFELALGAVKLAKELAESIHDQINVGLVLLEFGFIQQVKGKYDDAIDLYKQVMAIADASGNQWLAATAIGSTGLAFRRQGRLLEALEYELRCLPMFEALGDKEKVSYRLSDVGMTYLRLGDYELASKYLQQSLTLFEQRDDQSGIGFVTQNLGILSFLRNDNARALQYNLRAIALDKEMGNRHAMSSLLGNIGNLYQIQNDYAQAMNYYRQSLVLSREMGDQLLEGATLQNIGGVYNRRHDWDNALDSFRKSQAIFERAGIKDGDADCFAAIGEIFEQRHQFSEAREQFLKSLALNQESGKQERIAESLGELAENDNAQRKPAEALESSSRACAIAAQMNDRGNIVSCRTVMGESYRLLHQPEKAREAFDEAILAVESIRQDVAGGYQQQQTFLEAGNAKPYQDAVELLVEEKKLSDAFSYMERAKARALLNVLSSRRERIDKVMAVDDRETRHRLETKLVSLNTQIEQQGSGEKTADLEAQRDKIRLQLQDFETQMYSRYPELRVQRGQAPVITLDEASGLPFDEKTALLEFMVAETETVLLVLTRQRPGQPLTVSAYLISVDADTLGAKAQAFRQQMAERRLGFRTSARNLYALLLHPAAAQIEGKSALVIVSDSTLWNLPFQSLLDPSGHYVLEKYAIAYAPSFTVMREMMHVRQKRHPDSSTAQSSVLLAMADPILWEQTVSTAALSYRGGKPAPLPDARREAAALKQLYGDKQSAVYVGDDAREDVFKAEAGKFEVLHLATHSVFNDASPMYSHILLSPGADSKEDGLLEAWEIMQMDLKADLAVLSACETGRGRVSAGEGLIGLTWAFFVAGVPTTVVSQWKVESASTAKLMLAFHRTLKAGDARANSAFTTARALQRAELQLLHDPQYSHPFYWAGFVVVGNPQ